MKPAKTVKNWIWQISRPDVWRIVLLSLLNGVSSGGMVLFALVSQKVIDIATGDMQGNLWLYGSMLAALLLLEIVSNTSYQYLKVWTTGKVEMRLKENVFSALFTKRLSSITDYHSGELLNRMTSDAEVVVSGVVTLIPQLVALITRLLACASVLFVMDWRFTLVLTCCGALMLFFSRFYGIKMKSLHKDCQSKDDKAKAFSQESLANWMVIQSFGGYKTVHRRLDGLLVRHFKTKVRRIKWNNVAHAAMYLLFSGGYYGAVLWGAVRLAAGAITYGTLTAFLQIVSQIRTPFVNMSGIVPQYYSMIASAERIIELENLPEEPRLPQLYNREELYARLKALQAQDVCFSYDEEKVVLQDADFTVNKGEFIALAGFSGIGKTTLFKLLLGFYAPDAGSLVAQLEDESVPLGADTRCLFAYVPQQNMLLSGTVRENIAFCCPDASDEAIWEAAKVADVEDAIRQQPGGLDTVLGERGSGLSEGQLQRLAIARAVLSDAPILLLDECTASLDEATEERVLRNLRALPNRTCLCISHRPAALEICDRVVRVEDGKFVED